MKFIAPTAAAIGSVLLLAPTKIEALCAAFVKYDACSTKAAYAMAACNNLVTSTPTFAFWDCVCTNQNAMTECMTICYDDSQIMLQYQLQKSSVSGNCQYVQQLKDLGLDAPPIDPNASITANGTTLPAPKKKELPPMPTKNNTRPVLLMDNGASSSTLAAATGLIGTVACVFGFLL